LKPQKSIDTPRGEEREERRERREGERERRRGVMSDSRK
jgi:hypothetical protein